MGVCRRIFKNYEPSELTICVTIYTETRSPPRFDHWNISKPGCPPRIISCSKGSTYDENRERRSKKKLVKKRKKSDISEKSEKSEKEFDNVQVQILSDQPLLHSDSATLICDDVAISSLETPKDTEKNDLEEPGAMFQPKKLESQDRHVSVTSLDSVAGLGGTMSMTEDSDEVVMSRRIDEEVNSEDTDERVTSEEVEKRFEKRVEDEEMRPKNNGEKFDLLANGDVDISAIQLMINDVASPKKKIMVRRKKKSATPKTAPRYRDFTETSIFMYIEMNKQNIGEFVWDQQCTRIDALVAPILELDRTTTPEVPVEIEIFD